MRRFPPPWTIEKILGGLKVCDSSGQSLAYVYSFEGVAGGKMAASLRLSRRFHRLALFLAGTSLLVVGSLSLIILPDWNVPVPAFWSKPSINNMPAVSVIVVAPKSFDDPIAPSPADEPGLEKAIRALAEMEKSKMLKIEGVKTVQMPPEFEWESTDRQRKIINHLVTVNWRTKFGVPLTIGLATTLAVSFAVYVVVRAIGWVIGGFDSSS